MNSAEYVSNLTKKLKDQGKVLSEVAWQTALACVGWAYVFGARGQYCTPANRRARYSDAHPTIKTKCQNFNGSGSTGCKGCKWYPKEKYTRFFDCRGFTYWILKQAYDWELVGAGATSQWNTEKNWQKKGKVSDGIPADTLVCLFVRKGEKMEHTGLGCNDQTIECSSGVQHFTKRNKKWTHWAIPVVVTPGELKSVPQPEPVDPDAPPTLKKGSKGAWVTKLQTMLMQKGYDLGKYGADGDFGSATQAAVKLFQKDNGLNPDGVVGEKTWAALEKQEPMQLYSVTVLHLTESQAKALAAMYPNAEIEKEVG